jgi:hypothetical protein
MIIKWKEIQKSTMQEQKIILRNMDLIVRNEIAERYVAPEINRERLIDMTQDRKY